MHAMQIFPCSSTVKQSICIGNYTVREVLMKNHTRVWRIVYNTASPKHELYYKYFAKQKCDFPLILRGKCNFLLISFLKKCFTDLLMFLVLKNPAPRGVRDPCQMIFNRPTMPIND